MLVGQRVANNLHLGRLLQDLLAHLVHGVLDRGGLVLGERLEGDVAGRLESLVEPLNALLHVGDGGKGLPVPGGINVGRQDTVPSLAEGGVLVPDEAVEGRAGGLKDGETLDGGLELNASLAGDASFHVAGLVAVAVEAVGVGLAVDVDASPSVNDHLDVGGVDVGVLVEEVLAEVGGVKLRGVDGVLLGLDVNGVLDRIGSHNNAVVGLGVTEKRVSLCWNSFQGLYIRSLNLALEKAADGHLSDGLSAGSLILVHLVDTNIVLSIASSSKTSHFDDCVCVVGVCVLRVFAKLFRI